MTQEDKQLLIKDLCARLPYEVKVLTPEEDIDDFVDIVKDISLYSNKINEGDYKIEDIKPYLFPMSSLTEDQKKDCNMLLGNFTFDNYIKTIDWLNARYFDYRGLIDKGLALDATGLNIY